MVRHASVKFLYVFPNPDVQQGLTMTVAEKFNRTLLDLEDKKAQRDALIKRGESVPGHVINLIGFLEKRVADLKTEMETEPTEDEAPARGE